MGRRVAREAAPRTQETASLMGRRSSSAAEKKQLTPDAASELLDVLNGAARRLLNEQLQGAGLEADATVAAPLLDDDASEHATDDASLLVERQAGPVALSTHGQRRRRTGV